MNEITYLNGDATQPKTNGRCIIAHVCNDIGAWGKGFVLAVSRRWKKPEQRYKELYKSSGLVLGDIQFVMVEENIIVANMIAQHGIRRKKSKKIPLSYTHLTKCLISLTTIAKSNKCSVHMPMIGCGLAGGDWTIIEKIIYSTLVKNDIDIYVYKWNGK